MKRASQKGARFFVPLSDGAREKLAHEDVSTRGCWCGKLARDADGQNKVRRSNIGGVRLAGQSWAGKFKEGNEII